MKRDGIAVVIVEDIADYRETLRLAIESDSSLCVTGAYANVPSLLDVMKEAPDLVVMDINLPMMSGIEGVVELKKRFPDLDVLMCTVYEDDDNIFQSLRAGACGYILKSTPLDEILAAIHEVYEGGAPMTPKVARRVLSMFRPKPAAHPSDELSERESELLALLGEGKSYRAIADALSISLGTVQSHVKNIYQKLHVHSKSEIITWLSSQPRARATSGGIHGK